MSVRTYDSPESFKQALEQRLRTAASSGADIARHRQLLVFDRFLARVVAVLGDTAMLKGGLVLELRLARARTTKDVDMRVVGAAEGVLARLQDAGRRDLGDFMTFEVLPDDEHPEIRNEGMQYEGLRFRTECRLAGKIYGRRFGTDVAFGDPIFGEAEVVTARDTLGFAGIEPPTLRLYPVETHIAEKLHAYSIFRRKDTVMTRPRRPALRPGAVYRTRAFGRLSANAPRLVKRLVAAGELVSLAHGLYAALRQSRFGPVPPADDELVRAFLDGAPFVFTGPDRWNALGLGTTVLFAAPLVYNTKRSGTFDLGGRRFILRRVPFPRKPTPEWYAIDLLEHAGEAGTSREALAPALTAAVRRGSLDHDRLRAAAERYGSKTTRAIVAEATGPAAG